MYYILSNEYTDEGNQVTLGGNIYYPNSGNNLSFLRGTSMRSDFDGTAEFTIDWSSEISRKGYLTDHVDIAKIRGLVLSENAVQLLKKLDVQNVELFDLVMKEKNGEVFSSDYRIVNIVGEVDCIDLDSSIIRLDEDGDVLNWKKIILDESKIPSGMKLFRLSKLITLPIFHEEIVEEINRLGLTGFKFYKPEAYR